MRNSYCAGQASIEAAKAEAQGGLGLLTAAAGAGEKDNRSMMQIKIDQEAEKRAAEKKAAKEGKGKRKADDTAGEDEASKKQKAEEGRKGFDVKVTDEEMGKSCLGAFVVPHPSPICRFIADPMLLPL